MVMDGREASNQMQIRDSEAFFDDLPGMDGDGDARLSAAFTHGRVALFLSSLFRFSILENGSCKRVIATGSKYLLGVF
jgi:hypothetical protein